MLLILHWLSFLSAGNRLFGLLRLVLVVVVVSGSEATQARLLLGIRSSGSDVFLQCLAQHAGPALLVECRERIDRAQLTFIEAHQDAVS